MQSCLPFFSFICWTAKKAVVHSHISQSIEARIPMPQISRHPPAIFSSMDTIDISNLCLHHHHHHHRPTMSLEPDVIDIFAPKQSAFFATRSRVVRLYNFAAMPESLLSAVFLPHNSVEQSRIPVPNSLWELRDNGRRDSIWAVFRTHEEACAALSLSGRAMSVTTALESDLEPFHKLHRVALRNPASTSSRCNTNTLELQPPAPLLRVSSSLSDFRSSMPENSIHSSLGEYTLSSNPPNPKTSFRLGDWICSSPNCAAHNFGRNLTCIGCGCPRSNSGNGNGSGSSLHHNQQHPHNTHLSATSSARAPPSPRFNNVTYYSTAPPPSQSFQAHHHHQQQQQQQAPQPPRQHTIQQHATIGQHHTQSNSSFGSSSSAQQQHVPANPPKSSHPLLTPSGRAFAIGGKVQNISSDPLSPCIMYWPDNEPFPEQGQIRPSGLVGVAQPPILNTGNRGPISHQPGDWICQKCNYLNWRRRKVCQTCLPYAEGNGDSISAAVQAERIALLTSVLSQTQIDGGNLNIPSVTTQAPRPHSLTPPQVRRSFIDLAAPQTHMTRSVHRSQSHFALGQQYASASQSPVYTTSSPIYQTSGHRQEANDTTATATRLPSPLYSTGPNNFRSSAATAQPQNMHRGPNPDGVNVPRSMNVVHSGFNNVPSVTVHAPAPLLPSFLQDMVQSPALSPTSTTTSSADLSSIEEYEEVSSPRAIYPRARGDSGSSDMNSPIANIWRLDGEESKSLSAFPLPNHQELVGARKNVNNVIGESLRA